VREEVGSSVKVLWIEPGDSGGGYNTIESRGSKSFLVTHRVHQDMALAAFLFQPAPPLSLSSDETFCAAASYMGDERPGEWQSGFNRRQLSSLLLELPESIVSPLDAEVPADESPYLL
jgi:hypothetical protein